MVEGEMDMIQTHVRNAKDLQGELLKKFELAIKAGEPVHQNMLTDSSPKQRSPVKLGQTTSMSFKMLPLDISRKQKTELIDQKIIEFEDFMLEMEERHNSFQSVSFIC